MTQRASHLLEQPLLDASAVDLAAASRLTYVLRQTFRYDYDRPVHDLRQRLVVVPAARHGSARRLFAGLAASVPDAVVARRRQRTGNVVVTAALDVVAESVDFTLTAVVQRRGGYRDHLLPGSAASHPRWLRPTRLTAADDAVLALAALLRSGHPLDVAESACAAVHAAMPYEYGVTSTRTTAAEALAAGRGVCQDHAHVMLAILRSAGVASRYVSGHLLGEGGTHAWVEVLVPDGEDTRAVAMDPCNGCRVDARYLTVATGRDYLDVAPTSGSYRGDAVGRLTATKQVGLAEAA